MKYVWSRNLKKSPSYIRPCLIFSWITSKLLLNVDVGNPVFGSHQGVSLARLLIVVAAGTQVRLNAAIYFN